ncbi:MAG: FkbM family methyltransferase [Candidatus Omnitrophica bacterium]|nr:FkbM family methyltransferase [Candidatus Omnitrophota bacterium]
MTKRLLKRLKEIVCEKGIKGYLLHIKWCLYNKPFIDEIWYLLNYYLHPLRKVLKNVQGSKMLLDLSDSGINRDLFLFGCREPESTKIFKTELREGSKIAEIGANIGYYVLIESQIVGNTGRIYAIEPAPQNFARLKENIKINSYPIDITLYNTALSDKKGKARFSIATTCNNCRLFLPGVDDGKSVEVTTNIFDELFFDKEIDVIRMDSEGGEWLIIKGMECIFRSRKPLKMFIEVHPMLIEEYGGNIEEFLSILANAGFELKYLVVWEPLSHFIIPYIKGRTAREQSIEYNMPLRDLLEDETERENLCCKSGHKYEAGYKMFLNRE